MHQVVLKDVASHKGLKLAEIEGFKQTAWRILANLVTRRFKLD